MSAFPTALLMTVMSTLPLAAQMGHSPAQVPGVSADAIMVDKLGGQAPLDVPLRDEEGRAVTLRDLVQPGKPILLNPFYYGCPGMCGAVQNATLNALEDLDLVPGQDYSIVSVDIDAKNGPDTSRLKKRTYVGAWQEDLPGVDLERHWRFATGEDAAIRSLTDAVGFQFQYREQEARIDHPPTLVFLAPDGTVTRYLNMGPGGFSTRDMRLALYDASSGEVGGFIEQILVSCLTFDSETGVYQLAAMTVMKVGGALTIAIFLIVAFVLVRKDRRRPNRDITGRSTDPSEQPVAVG